MLNNLSSSWLSSCLIGDDDFFVFVLVAFVELRADSELIVLLLLMRLLELFSDISSLLFDSKVTFDPIEVVETLAVGIMAESKKLEVV